MMLLELLRLKLLLYLSQYVCQAATNAAICAELVHQATAAMLATSMAVAAECANVINGTYKGQHVWATIGSSIVA
jgi:hypothetical protein